MECIISIVMYTCNILLTIWRCSYFIIRDSIVCDGGKSDAAALQLKGALMVSILKDYDVSPS